MAPIRFTIFRLVTQRFGRLRGVRPLTQAFDAGLGVLTILTAPSVYGAISKARNEIKSWPDITESAHKLGGHQFDWHGEELGHIHSNGIADVRLTPSEKDDVLSKDLAVPHHIAPKSSWVTYFMDRGDQIQHVVNLFGIPYQRFTNPGIGKSEAPTEEYHQ
jgi:Family of unknown function (DUF5519)